MNLVSFVVPAEKPHLRAFLTLLLCFSASTMFAQLAGRGEIRGTVTDPQGAIVRGAKVVAVKQATGVATTAKTTSAGDFTIPSLEPGEYTVSVSSSGFENFIQEHVQVDALGTQSLNPKLVVGSASETVTVNSLPPQLDTTNATIGGTLENDVYSALPIEMGAYGQPDQRRATDFVYLIPGVQSNYTTNNSTTNSGIVNGSGSRGGVTTVYIDGLPFVRAGFNGDPRFVWTAISVDAVDQFQVQTSGYSAIYEGQGVQNYTIKAGAKLYHGETYEFFRNTALDTWGWLGSQPNPITGVPVKPKEHNNEYGINLSGPLVPFGRWKEKLFAFGNYNGFRYASSTPTQMTFPTAAQQAGNFQGVLITNIGSELSQPAGVGIYDPTTQTACTSNSTNGPCRYRFGYVGSGTVGPAGNPVLGPGGIANVDVIPLSDQSPLALKMQSFLPPGISGQIQNNYISPNTTGLSNWSHTERIDYIMSPKSELSFLGAFGRQASNVPVGQYGGGKDVGPLPYNFSQAYAPKTDVGAIEHTYTFTPNVVNQLKYGYARYISPGFVANALPPFAATTLGFGGLPGGQTSSTFPITTFSGTNAPTGWGGSTANVTLAENYTLLDNVQWNKGKHSITAGGQIAWLLYNTVTANGGDTPLTITNTPTETSGLVASSNTKPTLTSSAGTGLSYAGFLLGQFDKVSFTQYSVTENAARFRALSGYVQDNWKITQRLTLDLGVRYDFFPTVTEAHDHFSYFDPNVANPVTGTNGGLQFVGHGSGTCNCDTPVHNFYRHIGPRLGAAYLLDDKTVLRASWGVMFTHGNLVGGRDTSLGVLGFSAAPSTGLAGSLPTGSAGPFNGVFPSYAPPLGVASGSSFGTGYTNVAGYTGTPSGTMSNVDPYLGGRAPEYVNYTLGLQHQWASALVSTITYVGSQGHFIVTDGLNARGYYANQLDPKYLYLGSNLGLTGTALQTFCAAPANAGVCPAQHAIFSGSQSLSTLLKPFPFQSVNDLTDYVSNTNYNSLQMTLNMRAQHGLTIMASYVWARSIDNGGSFRTGYPIAPGQVVGTTRGYAADAIERTVSTSNQPQHVVITGVYELPFGKQVFASHEWQRAIFGGFKFSEILQASSGSPLAVTASSCPTNQAQSTCYPILNPNWSGNPRINGRWGSKTVAAATTAVTYITPSVNADTTGKTCQAQGPFINPTTVCLSQYNYQFSNSPRTAPYNLTSPGNYQLDFALVRSFPLHHDALYRLDLRAELYNVTNHTFFAVASTQVGNAAFGTVTTSAAYNRRAAQLAARLIF